MNNTLSSAKTCITKDEKSQSIYLRLIHACEGISYRELGRLTDTHPETVRRYMQGQNPSAVFLANLNQSLGISVNWLLSGQGPMKISMIQAEALANADPGELFQAIAKAYTELSTRMESMEQSLKEMKHTGIQPGSDGDNTPPLRARAIKRCSKSDTITLGDTELTPAKGEHDHSDLTVEPKPAGKLQSIAAKRHTRERSDESARTGRINAQRIRDAIAKRPS